MKMKKMLCSTCFAILAGIGIANAQVNITNSGTEAENPAWTYQTIDNTQGIRDFSPGRTDNASYFAHSVSDYQPFLISPRIDDASSTAPTFHVSFWIRDTVGGITWDAPLAVMVLSDNGGINANNPSALTTNPWPATWGSQATVVSNSSSGLYDSTAGQYLPSNFTLSSGWHHITADITPTTVGSDYYIGISDGSAPSGDELQWDDFNISSTSTGTTITPYTLQNTCTDIGAENPITINGVTVQSTVSGNAKYGQGVTLTQPSCAPSIGATDGTLLTPVLVPLSGGGSGNTGSVTFAFSQAVNNIVVKFSEADSTNSAGAEHLTFTTNGGGTVTVSGSTCNETQSGNTFTSTANSSNNETGGGIVTVSSSQPYTSLTITNNADPTLNGTAVVLCSSSIVSAVSSTCDPTTVTGGNNVTYNGVTVTRTLQYGAFSANSNLIAPDLCGYQNIANGINDLTNLLPASSAQYYGEAIYTFSQPVNDIVVVGNGANATYSPAETFMFNTDTGTVTTSENYQCDMTQTNDTTWKATNSSETNGGSFNIVVHSTKPYTQLTVTEYANYQNNGTIIGLCSASITPASSLPVGYAKQLEASPAGNNTSVLQWVTATEINNKGFEIQRSPDAENFSNIGFVASQAANGNSTKTLSYTYTDASPLPGLNYYRLLQTDLDGHTVASNIVGVSFSIQSALTVYPNPVHGSVTIAGLQAGSNVVIYSANGRRVKHFIAIAASQQVDVSDLTPGVYFVKAAGGLSGTFIVK